MANDFARELLRIVIAQVCQGVDFSGIEQTACDVLVDVLRRYIEEIGFYAHASAEHAGRIDCNLNDVTAGLSEMHVSIRDIIAFYSPAEEVAFARGFFNTKTSSHHQAVPKFPLPAKQKKRRPLTESEALPQHIPNHFPPLPEQHTWKNTPLYVAREPDRREIQKKKNKERTQMQKNLTAFHDEFSKTNVTNYDNFDDLELTLMTDEDFATIQSMNQDLFPPISPTPVSEDSSFVTSLYAAYPNAQPERMVLEGAESDSTTQHINAILQLNHANNVLEEPPAPIITPLGMSQDTFSLK